jgi:ribokinase
LTAASESPPIAVVGSVNLDIVVAVERHPVPGETVLGGDRVDLPGGKGANQAVAAARLGREVAFVGRVGDDAAGRRLRAGLEREGVDVTHLATDPAAPSGVALIAVAPGGENTIIVSPGANARVDPGDVDAAGALLAEAAVTLLQLEIPQEAVAAAVDAAGGTVVLNPAPAPARALDAELLARVDVLVPNRGELELLGGRGEPSAVARSLGGPRAVVVTLGAEGALVVEGERVERVPAPAVRAVDTTGAGDAFCGALADALARGAELVEAARWAVTAAALSVERTGAQSGMPTAEAVVAATIVAGWTPRET